MSNRERPPEGPEDALDQESADVESPAAGTSRSTSIGNTSRRGGAAPAPGKRPRTMRYSAGRPAEAGGGAAGAEKPGSDAGHDGVIRRMESAFGMSFLGVNLRTDGQAAERAAGMGARAYTDGREIGFAAGAFDPGSRAGLHTIAHEFAHVAQKRGGTPGAVAGGAGLGAGEVRAKDAGGGVPDDVEAAADAAADSVVNGAAPNLAPVEIGAVALEGGKPARKVPPVGSYFVGVSSDGALHYTFNGNEVRTMWAGDGIADAVGYYLRDAFPGAPADVIEACRKAKGLQWTKKFDPKKWVGPEMTASVAKNVQEAVEAWFAEHHPEIRPRVISSGFKDSGQGGGGKGKPKGATTTPGGKDPKVDSKELTRLKDIYEWIAKTFGNHVVFREGGMSLNDFLAFHAAHPELFENLPPLPEGGTPTTDLEKWRQFLEAWKKRRDDATQDGKEQGGKGGGKEGGGPEGSPRGEPGGTPGGIIRFTPKAQLTLAPKVDKYVKGSSVKATVEFDRSDPDNSLLNSFSWRADYDWSLIDTATGKVADTGPLLERISTYRSYDATLGETGNYRLRVEVTSPWFKDPTQLTLDSPNLVVVNEGEREKEVFDTLFVGANDPKMPFVRDPATGRLVLKPGFAPLSLDDEVSSIDLQLGALKALRDQGKLTKQEYDDYVAYFEKQKAGLLAARKQLEGNPTDPSGKKNPTYFVRGSYVSRETSAAMEVKAYMTQSRRAKTGNQVDVGVHLIDASLDPGNPTHHEGRDAEAVAAGGDERPAWGAAEKNAIDEMAAHWNEFNDYPDGTVHLAIRCLESDLVVEKSINTYHRRKTGKAILGAIAVVGGVVLIAASPFTGGSSAVVGVIFITSAVAGTAATLMSVQERYQKEGTLKIDGRLALDVLQLVSTFMAAGSFSNAFKAWGAVGKGMYLGSMLGLDVAQGVLIAADVKEQLLAVEANYKPKILAATDPNEKARLERERDSALAQILGHAMMSGGFILVSVGTGVHQIRSVGRLSGKQYTVREEIKALVESGDAAAIRAALEKKAVSFEEKAYLEEALSTTSPKSAEQAKTNEETPATEGPGGGGKKTTTPEKKPPAEAEAAKGPGEKTGGEADVAEDPGADKDLAKWKAAKEQETDLTALESGKASKDQRKNLADELRRQVPDIGLVDAVRAGKAKTVMSVVTPGGGETGIKRMNDELIGYGLNSTKLIPQRNQIIKEAFEGQGFQVIDQNYKTTTLVSDKTPAESAAGMKKALAEIDARMKPLLESVLDEGIKNFTAERSTLAPTDPDVKLLSGRIDKLKALRDKIRASKEFQFDLQVGAAEIKAGKDASYADVLGAEMDATKAAIMARDKSFKPSAATGDPRAQVYSQDEFIAFCKETVAIKDGLEGATLPYNGQRRRVFEGGQLDRDILRAVRKDSYKEKLSAEDEKTLEQVKLYFTRVNAVDYVKHFTGSEVGTQGAKVAEASALVKKLEGARPASKEEVEAIEKLLRSGVPQADSANEAQFYNRAAGLRNRVVLNADIKDMGLDLFDGYAKTIDAVGRGKTTDLAAASRAASDRVVTFKREAAREFTRFYRDELLPAAREAARAQGRNDLLAVLDKETEPVMLLGGDEITVSLHGAFEELGLVPRVVAKLTDPSVANARVAVTRSGAGDGASGHVAAMNGAQTGHDKLKKTLEPYARDLRDKAVRLPAEQADRARSLADRIDRMYTQDVNGRTELIDQDGKVVDPTALEAEVKALLNAPEGK